jgi:hypothetical protein
MATIVSRSNTAQEMGEQANPDLCARTRTHWEGIGGHGYHSNYEDSELQPREQKPACDRRFPHGLSLMQFSGYRRSPVTTISLS